MKKETIKELLIYLGIIVFVVLLRTFIITPVRVDGTSMNSTLNDGDIMILNKINYRFNDIERFDIVVIKYYKERFIKRVIGLPGETIKYIDNELYINNIKVEEPFLQEETDDYSYEGFIPENCYFVMGDNRNDSLDSRYFDCFMKKDIVGSANLVLFPFKDFGMKK